MENQGFCKAVVTGSTESSGLRPSVKAGHMENFHSEDTLECALSVLRKLVESSLQRQFDLAD